MTAMSLRAGWRRGLIELRQSFTSGADLWGHFFWPLLMVGAWAVVAPVVLRRMARRESGSSLAGRQEKAMRRVG